jgi:hypothetical protein
MRLLFDQNLSHRLVASLATEYPGSVHERDVAFARRTASPLTPPSPLTPALGRAATRAH